MVTFQEGDGELVRVQVTDIFSQVGVKNPGNKTLQHPAGSGLVTVRMESGLPGGDAVCKHTSDYWLCFIVSTLGL